MNKKKIAIVSAPYYQNINEGLLHGACHTASEAGYEYDTFDILGALELPLACQALARRGDYCAIVVLGCVIRGETAHFDHVCAQSASGIMQVSLAENMPIGNGILTVENRDQALARADKDSAKGKANKGREATAAALALLPILHKS